VPLDEDDAIAMVPYVPRDLVTPVRQKFLEMKAAERFGRR
jgi:hypothetical protein